MYNILILAGALASASPFPFKNFANSNCTDFEFFCDNFQCIPLSKQCDGTSDCADGSDEQDCEMFLCKPPHFFKCKNGRCLSSAFVCDSENDCDDFSDEENCEDFKKKLHQNATCPEDQWQCTDKLCIPKEWVCNGSPDCLDGSDEVLGCSPKMECEGFRCKNQHCILNEWVCDGQDDCRDNSDEENCEAKIAPSECTTENNHFLCSNNKTCIKLDWVCDDKPQCPDQSDEGIRCKEACKDCSHTCAKFPTGPKCLCPKGYHTLDSKHCQDINECEIYGICDQKCRNTQGSYECFCEENYSLEEDKKSCKAHFGEPVLYFSSKKEIRAYHLRSQIYSSVGKNLKQVVGVDSDGQYVYWTDIFSEHESIVRSLKNGGKRELLVTSGLGSPEDIHIDHITRNLYFTDAERQHIGVCTNDGTHCTVLINKDIHKPRGIVLNSIEGEMYWSDWGDHPLIARAYMDGTNATSFVSTDIEWPNGLTIDHPNSRLYWTDAKLLTIESIRLDGTDRRVVLQDVVKHPYAIAIFEDRLYWSDWATHSIESCNKFTGKNHITVVKEQKDYIYGISIYHPNNHKKLPKNSCVNAMCSDICLLKGTGHTCACPEGKELSSDGRMCKEVEKKQKLILGADNLLLEVEHKMLGKHSVEALPAGVKSVGALAYNSIENVIYVSDVDIRKIISVNLHSGLSKVVPIGEIGNVISLDYDYLGNNLYWCDSARGTVEVFNLNTKSRTILIHDLHGEVPQSIALVPEEGVMFIAFQKLNHHSHIDRFMMDGTLRTHPIEHGTLGPVSLWYDFTLHRIFIADAGTGNIESTSIEGDDRHGFRSLQTAPIGITSLKNDIFWVEENSRDVYWADKFNTGSEILNKRITLDLPHNIENMKIISVTPRRIGLSPCQKNNGGCSHLCLQSQKKIVCSCPIGMVLDIDNQTCMKRSDCTINEFYCHKSNLCILTKFRCDGTNNCPNNEDEDDCQKPNHCPLNYFQCQDGECILEEFKCDSNYNCRDKSDERNCSQVATKQCPLNHFQCKSKACINEHLVCDGIEDCEDGDDEENCLSTVCKDKEFRCLSGACISKDWECDHDFDCPDFSDEHPGCPSCDSSMFTCHNGKCIDKSFVCDNENDCGDHSDETSCTKEEKCKEDEFSCSLRSLICLPKSAFCNGTSECPNNEDEQNCSGECQFDEFSCKNNKCIPKSWVCDHSDDCGDNSDEEPTFCNHTIPESKISFSCEGKYQCKDGQCIDFSLVCNGKNDCFDGSDEDGVCNTSCNSLNNPCSHVCIKTPTGPMCKCDDGFSLQGDGQNCEDIDECENNPPPCGQICHNIPGLYLCDCYNGFALKTDRLTCKAEGKAMSIMFVSENQIREMSQMKNSLKLIYSKDTAPITGLDASVNKTVYFSVESSGTIVRMNTTSSKVEFMEGVGQPQKISLDWLTNNVYYVDNNPLSKSISVCNFEEKSSASLIKIDPHRQVSSLVVDSANRYAFYSVVSWWMFNSPNFVIYRSNLDGTGVQELVKSSSGYITGLSFDLYKKELYFVDQHQNWLHKIKYDGTKKTLLRANLTRPNGLDFFENHVYFQSNRVMEKCRLHSPFACDAFNFKGDFFTIVQDSKQPQGINPCMNHTCSYMCVASKINYKCLCEDGKLVNADEECESSKRESNSNDRRKIIAIHHYQHYNGHPGAVIAGVMITICLLIFVGLLFYVVKRRNYGSFNVIGMRFHNPGYGLQNDEAEKSIIQPGQHEYTNPMEIYEAENSSSKREVLVNV